MVTNETSFFFTLSGTNKYKNLSSSYMTKSTTNVEPKGKNVICKNVFQFTLHATGKLSRFQMVISSFSPEANLSVNFIHFRSNEFHLSSKELVKLHLYPQE